MFILLILIDCALFWGVVLAFILAVLGKMHLLVAIILAIITLIYTFIVIIHISGHLNDELPDPEIEDAEEAIKKYRRQRDA